jgi:uncharacterized protein
MKYLILLVVVLAVFWYLRSLRRGRSQSDGGSRHATAAAPQDMVECPICSLHLPRADALPGPDGQLYCCAEHRSRAGSDR